MKKILSTALMFVILSATTVETINAARAATAADMAPTAARARRGQKGRRPAAGRRGRGRGARSLRNNSKQVQVVLETAKTTDNPVVKAEAMKTANELAKELLMDLQDRTWAGDVLGKYTPEQVAAAGAKYTNLEIQRTQLVRDIEFKQNEINSMSTKSMIFWTKAEGGKEEAHKIASQELADMKATLVRTNKAMRDQAVIAGKEYCSAIRMAVGALTAVAVAGGVALVDKYANESKGMTALSTKYSAVREELAMGEGETYREYVGRGVAKTGTYIKGLGVTISDKYDSFNQWAKTQWSKLPNFRGADKQELKDLLEENKRLKAELETLNKKLSKDVDNSNLQNEQNQAQVNLQENINQIEEKTGDAEAGELVGEPAI